MSNTLSNYVSTVLSSNAAADVLSLRRIILEKNVPLDNNQKLYFCGFISSNNGDFLFGRLSSIDLTSITLEIVF